MFLLDDKVKSAEDITKAAGIPVFAEVPTFAALSAPKSGSKNVAGRNEKV